MKANKKIAVLILPMDLPSEEFVQACTLAYNTYTKAPVNPGEGYLRVLESQFSEELKGISLNRIALGNLMKDIAIIRSKYETDWRGAMFIRCMNDANAEVENSLLEWIKTTDASNLSAALSEGFWDIKACAGEILAVRKYRG